MIADKEFFSQIGKLVVGRLSHEVACYLLWERLQHSHDESLKTVDALLRCSSGYSRAVIRQWACQRKLNLTAERDELLDFPITSPRVLASG
ncbi:MAG: hypothetical protein AAB288_13930, partial [Acidobacteriota bacterium]